MSCDFNTILVKGYHTVWANQGGNQGGFQDILDKGGILYDISCPESKFYER